MTKNIFDIIVVGAGHAGCEAALAGLRVLARGGKKAPRVLVVTGKLSTIGHLSCNPSIGGLAKGHLVKEIDALGGEMGVAADLTAIQFRRLNMSKGPAVRATRVQTDRTSYIRYMQDALLLAKSAAQPVPEGLSVVESIVEKIIVSNGTIAGVETGDGKSFFAPHVIITTGTFLNGLLHFGMEHVEGGRADDFSVRGLSKSLIEAGLKLGRLKTGTCPRLVSDSIDYSLLERQDGDKDARGFSFRKICHRLLQVPCFIAYTNETTHEIIRIALSRSPLYSGKIKGVGPRYCPSIEDKIVRFSDKERHHIFIEPEGLDIPEVYVNGLSTSLPLDVQLAMVRSIKGLERAKIARSGYAVEYDFIHPTQLFASLETKVIRGLWCAGQINGTSGYEEAAAQGLMAGMNAARALLGLEPVVLSRSEAYIGVLIDDLVTKGTDEPYRMFTSRAEYRLLLREDNADMRLSQIGFEAGLLDEEQFLRFEKKRNDVAGMVAQMKDAAKRKKSQPVFDSIDSDAIEAAQIEFKYEGYIKLQSEMVDKLKELERFKIPKNFDYSKVAGLSNEVRAKLDEIKPASLAAASEISGVTPAAIHILMIYLK